MFKGNQRWSGWRWHCAEYDRNITWARSMPQHWAHKFNNEAWSVHGLPSTCTSARRTYAAGHRRRIRGEQRIYPVRAALAVRGGAADPLPPLHGCPLCWSSSSPAWSPPGGHAQQSYRPLQGILLTARPLRGGRSSSSFSGTGPRRWRPPARPLQRRRRQPGCWVPRWGWRRSVLQLRAGREVKDN